MKVIEKFMEMVYKTKLRNSSGSIVTTVPKAIVDFLRLEVGEDLKWKADIRDNNVIITVEPIKKE